jgi:arylsulfatase A-like enzyme
MTRWRCLTGLLVVSIALAACEKKETVTVAKGRAPIILISIDTLRADRLPAYGYTRVETPAIDRFAKDAVVFENAYAHVPLTLPSHVSILTGLLPPDHGVRNNIGYSWDTAAHPSVTDGLRRAGYRTGAAVSAYVLRGSTGMGRAFDFYDDSIASQYGVATGQLQRSGQETAAIARRWISEAGTEPFFFMLHLFEPHSPYEPPQPFFDRYADKYDGEIAATDAILEEFFAFLRERGLYETSTIVLLSDHGEGLGDHGEEEHGVFLYREAIHVPLMIKLPNRERAGTRVTSPVELIDVAPTLARLAALPGSVDAYRGVDLFGPSVPDDRRVYSETLFPRLHLGWSELRSLIDARHHYIEAPRPELFDHVADPDETVNILADQRRLFASMRTELEGYDKKLAVPSNVDPEDAARLAALGYIGTIQKTEGDLPDPKDQIGDFEKMKLAGQLAATGRHGEAVGILRGIVEKNPRFADAWSLLAIALEQMGRDDEAIEAYKGGLRSSLALKDELALSLAGLLLKTGQLDQAEEHARLAFGGQPAGAHQMLARIAIARGELDAAEAEARLAMSDPTMSPRSSVIIAQAKAKQGKLDEALNVLLETKKDADARGMRVETLDYAIGDIFASREQWAEAEKAFLSEIARFPGNLQAYASLAVVYVLGGQHEKVDPILDRMVQANPSRLACLTAAETLEALGDAKTGARWRREAERFN